MLPRRGWSSELSLLALLRLPLNFQPHWFLQSHLSVTAVQSFIHAALPGTQVQWTFDILYLWPPQNPRIYYQNLHRASSRRENRIRGMQGFHSKLNNYRVKSQDFIHSRSAWLWNLMQPVLQSAPQTQRPASGNPPRTCYSHHMTLQQSLIIKDVLL